MGNSKTIEVKTENGPVIVRKLALKDYAVLFSFVKKLPGEFGKVLEENDASIFKDNEKLFPILFQLTGNALDEFIETLAIPTNKDKEFLYELDLADAMDVFAAIVELNNYAKVAETLKKMKPQKPAEQPQDKPNPTNP